MRVIVLRNLDYDPYYYIIMDRLNARVAGRHGCLLSGKLNYIIRCEQPPVIFCFLGVPNPNRCKNAYLYAAEEIRTTSVGEMESGMT